MRLPKNRLFDYTTPGKGVSKDEPKKKGVALFWDILSRKFWKMVSLNLLYILFSIPALIIQWFATYTILTLVFSELMTADKEFVSAVVQLCTFSTCIIFSLFGGGASTAGMAYILKNYRTDSHCWLWTDFISTFKSKFLKATGIFITDTVLLFLFAVNVWFYSMFAQNSIVAYLLLGLMFLFLFVFWLMHAYIYPILVSYDKKIFDIYKCSFILAIGKLPTTFASMALCLLVCALISFLACYVVIYAALLIPIVMFTLVAFINIFITYPIVQKYMGKSDNY